MGQCIAHASCGLRALSGEFTVGHARLMEELFAVQHGFNVGDCELLIQRRLPITVSCDTRTAAFILLGEDISDIPPVKYGFKFFFPTKWANNASTVIQMLVAIRTTGLV